MERALRRYKTLTKKRINEKRLRYENCMCGLIDEEAERRLLLEIKSFIPPRYKRNNRRQRRAQEKNALRHGREIPLFKNTDEWDWW